MIPWAAALAAQALLAWRLPPGAVRHLHTWQVASGLALMALRYAEPGWYGWALACWWPCNVIALGHACRWRFRVASLSAWAMLAAVAMGSAWHFQRDLVTAASLRWLVSTIAISYWLGAAWPDHWLTAYAALSYLHALAGAWVWYTWPALYDAHQWAQAVLFLAWAAKNKA